MYVLFLVHSSYIVYQINLSTKIKFKILILLYEKIMLAFGKFQL